MTPSGSRNPRHRPAPTSSGGWPVSPPRVRAREGDRRSPGEIQLAEHPTCQWQRRMVRCPAEAVAVVRSREGVLRSSCEQHVEAWLRSGGRRVA